MGITHTAAGSIKFGQSNLDISDEMNVEADRTRYEADHAKDIALSATHGIDEVMKANRLDALLFPGANGAHDRRLNPAIHYCGDRPVRARVPNAAKQIVLLALMPSPLRSESVSQAWPAVSRSGSN